MLAGITSSLVSLLALTQLGSHASYGQLVVSLVLMGVGAGTSLVTLTTASLAGVAPHDAGAASGLVNVFQQVGAALGLAVLVTVSSAAGAPAAAHAVGASFRGLDVVFGASAAFAVAALVLVATAVRLPSTPSVSEEAAVVEVPALDETWLVADAVA